MTENQKGILLNIGLLSLLVFIYICINLNWIPSIKWMDTIFLALIYAKGGVLLFLWSPYHLFRAFGFLVFIICFIKAIQLSIVYLL